LVGSDHSSASFHRQNRVPPDFTKIPNGVPGVQERPALLWTHGVLGRRISADQFVAVVSTNPARVHRMYPRKGTLAPGADADVVVWDPGRKTVVSPESSHSRADYSPYEQMTLTGAPERVYLRGALAYRNGEVLAPAGSGEFVHRATAPPAWESSEDSSGSRGGQSAIAESAV
jgi:dihydropyrimidinase